MSRLQCLWPLDPTTSFAKQAVPWETHLHAFACYNLYLADFVPDLSFLFLLASSASLWTRYSSESFGTSGASPCDSRHSLMALLNWFPISRHALSLSRFRVHTATRSPALRRLVLPTSEGVSANRAVRR